MKLKSKIFSILSSLCLLLPAHAVTVKNLNQVRVPIATQSVNDKNKALFSALGQVFIKNTGNIAVLNQPIIQSQLTLANQWLQEFSYEPNNISLTNEPFQLVVSFDMQSIKQTLNDAKFPIWGSSRPLILFWIVDEKALGKPEIIDNSSNDFIRKALLYLAENLGLPIVLPLMDMNDMNVVTSADIKNLSFQTLQAAANRYASDAMMIVRVQHEPQYHLDADLMMGSNHWQWSINQANEMNAWQDLLNNTSKTLSSQFAAVSENKTDSIIIFEISNITSAEQTAKLLRYLTNLNAIKQVELTSVKGSTVFFTIQYQGDIDALQKLFKLNKNIKALMQAVDANHLSYEWVL